MPEAAGRRRAAARQSGAQRTRLRSSAVSVGRRTGKIRAAVRENQKRALVGACCGGRLLLVEGAGRRERTDDGRCRPAWFGPRLRRRDGTIDAVRNALAAGGGLVGGWLGEGRVGGGGGVRGGAGSFKKKKRR